jgi:hypothetical protein
MKNLFILALIFSLSVSTVVTAQSKKTQKETFQATYNAMKTLVKSKEFKYVGEVVFEDRKRERLNSDSNTFSVDNSNVTGLLQALGEATKVIPIKGEISNYNVNFNDDLQNISIEFSVNKMKIYIDIKANGNAFLTVEGAVNNITQRGKLQNI